MQNGAAQPQAVPSFMPTRTTPNEPAESPDPKENATQSVNISGGTWNNVEGNQHFHFTGCSVIVNTQAILSASTSTSASGARLTLSSTSRAPSDAIQLQASCCEQNQAPSIQFLLAKNTLGLAKQLLVPHTNRTGTLKGVEPLFRDLEVLIDFSSAAYEACGGGTAMGRLIRRAIEARMEKCITSLAQIHTDIARLSHCSLPRIRYAHRVIHEWWTGNERQEILTIRQRISREVTAIGEWLRCLHS
jgi:hypothetical protein